jgi:hypothetical protein
MCPANGERILAIPLPNALSFPAKPCSVWSTAVNSPRDRFPKNHEERHMQLNVRKEVATMEGMAVGQLRDRYAEVFGETTNARNKQWMIKKIIWRLQSMAEGDLSERARARAMEIATDADIRRRPPKAPDPKPDALHRHRSPFPFRPTIACRFRSAAPSTPASPPTRGSSRSSIRSTPSGNRPRPTSPASSTRAGSACPSATTTAGSPGGNMDRPAP